MTDEPRPTPAAAARRRLTPPRWLYAIQMSRFPWLVAAVATCAVGASFARWQDFRGALPMLLTLAPVLPVLCVSGSYGGRADPFLEVSRTTPAGNFRLLLIRTGLVLLLCLPLLTVVAAFLPRSGVIPGPAAWLLPSLALTLLALVGGSYIGYWPAAAVTFTGWMVLVFSVSQVLGTSTPDGHHRPLADVLTRVLQHLIGQSQQMWWAIGGGVLTYLLTERRHSINRAGGPR